MKNLKYLLTVITLSLLSSSALAGVKIIFNTNGYGHPAHYSNKHYNRHHNNRHHNNRYYNQRYYQPRPRYYRHYNNSYLVPVHPYAYQRPVSKYKHYYHDPAYYDFKPQKSYNYNHRNHKYKYHNHGNRNHKKNNKTGRVTIRR